MCRILDQHGFVQVRQRGGHVVMYRRREASTITVPVPDHRALRLGPRSQSFASRNSSGRFSKSGASFAS
ncbi:MAG TPA: type II toxin-antitoxin system HicA family toxin [Chloroflexota bacterium]|nr:type II toxin-antitoxin system HicA family toxin [Chloroflexota bacterium]